MLDVLFFMIIFGAGQKLEWQMEIIKKRDRIKGVMASFKRAFADHPHDWLFADGRSPHDIIRKLAALDLKTCDAKAIDEIIGNDTWTALRCEECNEDYDFLIRFGEDPDYDARWADVCRGCLMKAVEMINVEIK